MRLIHINQAMHNLA